MKNNLLLLHGALGSKQQFKKLKDILSEEFQIYTLNFEGHGGKTSNKDFSIQLFSENALNFLRDNNIAATNIFGYSMGGYVALNLAKQDPELVQKIVTLGTKFNWTSAAAEKEIKMLNPKKIEEKIPAFAEKLKLEHAPNDWKELMHKTAKMMVGMGNGARLKEEDLKQINQKVLIGIGSEDRMVTMEESEKAANLLSNGTLKKIEGFHHPIGKNDPNELGKIIIDFMA